MKLGSLKGGRDGRLVVVSSDLAWCADATHIAPTLQAALDDWDRLAPQLELLAMDLEHVVIPRDRSRLTSLYPRQPGSQVALDDADGLSAESSAWTPAAWLPTR